MVLGRYPDLSIADARKARQEKAREVARGLCPSIERKREKVLAKGETLEKAAREWDAWRGKEGKIDPKTRATTMGRLEKHVFPALANRPLVSVAPLDLRHILDKLVKADVTDSANRTCTVLHQVFEWAASRGVIASNPVTLIRSAYPKPPSKHYAAVTVPEDIGALLRAIDGYSGQAVTRSALRLLPLVFVRSSELRGATWSEFDLDNATWTIAAMRMKVKTNGPHVVPLSCQAVAILRELFAITGPREHQDPARVLVFPGNRHGRPISDATLNAALDRLGYTSDVHRVHGFRSSASTILNEIAASEGGRRFNFEHIEAQLAHRPRDSVRDAYMRSSFETQRREMMQVWANTCDAMKAELPKK